MLLTYKYRIKDRSAKKTLVRHAYAANQVWNYCVAQQLDTQDRWRAGSKPRSWATQFELQKMCKGVGSELGIQQQSVQEICRVFTQSRDKAKRAPCFRSSFGTRRALGWIPFQAQSRQVCGNTVTYLGKRFRFWEGNRPLPSTAKGGAFVEDARGHWYVVFYVEIDHPSHAMIGAIGIDLGIKAFASLSNGQIIENPRHVSRLAHKLEIAQRANNKRKVTAIHAKIKNCRRDFLHKVSTELVRKHAFIAVGNVNSKRLAKTRMAKSVLDAGWSTFRDMLKYKSDRYVEVDEKFTTQTCSCCGSVESSTRPKGIAGLGIRRWECSDCGASHDRDVNAARNILIAALSAQRLAGESRDGAVESRQLDKHKRPSSVSRHAT
jgi:IS605 OrfB family transposase